MLAQACNKHFDWTADVSRDLHQCTMQEGFGMRAAAAALLDQALQLTPLKTAVYSPGAGCSALTW